MKFRTIVTAFAISYFGWVFIKDGTAPKLIDDLARGGKDFAKGLRGPARLA